MEARNAAGRRVSLLNDAAPSHTLSAHKSSRPHPRPLSYRHHSALARQHASPRSSASSPDETPELLRSSSYDSQASTDPTSPMTPAADYLYPHGRSSIFSGDVPPSKRPAYIDSSSRSTSYEEDSGTQGRPAKRYPCRYRDTHGCDKTFTTSGHASRHSKIHTAEKAVQCTFPGCQKKFTRADNMKQHLETHYKDKNRSSSAARAHRHSAMGRSRSSTTVSSVSSNSRDAMQWESDAYVTSPASPNGWEDRGFKLPIMSRPVAGRAPSSGLDALAMAIACQEDGVRA